mgnify:CR=1 FL=1|jgi:hypothetical protein
MTTIDEKLHFQSILSGLREEYPEAPEEEIQKMAILESDVLYCYRVFAFEDSEHKFRDMNWLRAKLIEYGRIDSSVTGADLKRAVEGNINRKRIYSWDFDNSMYNRPDVTKYKYNVKYVQNMNKTNPFESDEYKRITSGIF